MTAETPFKCVECPENNGMETVKDPAVKGGKKQIVKCKFADCTFAVNPKTGVANACPFRV